MTKKKEDRKVHLVMYQENDKYFLSQEGEEIELQEWQYVFVYNNVKNLKLLIKKRDALQKKV